MDWTAISEMLRVPVETGCLLVLASIQRKLNSLKFRVTRIEHKLKIELPEELT